MKIFAKIFDQKHTNSNEFAFLYESFAGKMNYYLVEYPTLSFAMIMIYLQWKRIAMAGGGGGKHFCKENCELDEYSIQTLQGRFRSIGPV